ncbi:MAG: hypothetical protein ACFFFK_05955, partial [Candidatus Thorarchaeota archaeon]
MEFTKQYVKNERIITLMVLVIFFCTFPFFYIADAIPRIEIAVIHALPATIAALLEFLLLWYKENPQSLNSIISPTILACFLLLQPFFPGVGILFVINDISILHSLYFWIVQGGFFVSWFTGRMIVRQVFIMTHSK